jgi:cytochrome d ubiquinol oxidase subunit II
MRGLEAISSIFNLSLGFALFFLVRILGALYFINNIDNETIRERAIKSIKIDMPIFLVFFLLFLSLLFTKTGFAYDENLKIYMQEYKYLINFLEMPFVLGMFIIGILMVVIAVFLTIHFNKTCCIKTGGLGVVLTVMALFLNVGLNNTSYYPSSFDLQSSLTIINSSGSHYTLTVMSYVSLMVPFVLAYIFYAWMQMDKVKITKEEISDPHAHTY